MREKNYLLTYKLNDKTDFNWFDTEEELNDFIEENEGIEVLDALNIVAATDLR